MHSKQADDGEVAEHLIQVSASVFAGVWSGIFASFPCGELFAYLGALDERVEDVEDGVAAPCIWILAEYGDFFLVDGGGGLLVGEALTVGAEGVELVDEFVDDIPRPVVLKGLLAALLQCHRYIMAYTYRRHLNIHRPLTIQNEMEKVAIAVVTLDLHLKRRLVFQRLCSCH